MSKVSTIAHDKYCKRQSHHNFTEEIMDSTSKTQATSEVLFQKMGNNWYVFTEVNGDMVYSILPDGMDPITTKLELFEVIEDHMSKISRHYRRKPEMVA